MSPHAFCRRAISSVACGLLLCVAAPFAAARPAPSHTGAQRPVDRFISRYDLVTFDPLAVAVRARTEGKLTITTADARYEIELAEHDLRAPNYRATQSEVGGNVRDLPTGGVSTFAGVVTNHGDAAARFTLTGRTVVGMLLLGDDRIFVEPLANYALDASPGDFVVYHERDVIPEAVLGTCGTTEAHRIGTAIANAGGDLSPDFVAQNRTIDLATETDNEYVSALGSAQAANDEIQSIMNQVEGVYQNEVALTFRIVLQNTWSGSDPYSGTTDPSAMLVEFKDYWNANFSGTVRDMSHMWTGRDMNGSTIGIAYVNVICNNPAFSYGVSQRYTSDPQKYVLTAHEMGHNLGACHSDDTTCNANPSSCTNTIMNSSVGTALTFCQFSRNQITAHVAANPSCVSLVPTTTIGVYTAATGTFFLKNTNASGSADVAVSYGPANATPLVGDWDGNGTTTVGIYTPATGTFFLRNSNTPGAADITVGYGAPNSVPLAGDWDGNGTTTIGIYVPASGAFFLRNSNSPGGADIVFTFGPTNSTLTPIMGDWNGDGKDTVGLYNPANGTFFLRNSNTPGVADLTFSFGPAGARPLGGDWTGIGKDTIGVYVPGTAVFFLKNSNAPGSADSAFQFGGANLVGLAGNWDGV